MVKWKKWFTLVELIVIITIISILSVWINLLINTSKNQSLNNNLKYNIDYVNNYINDLQESRIRIKDDIENKIKTEEDWNYKSAISYNIPFIQIGLDNNWDYINVNRKNINFSIDNNVWNDWILNKFLFTEKKDDSFVFKPINNAKINKIILFENLLKEELLIDYQINSIMQNDYTIRKKSWEILYSETFNEIISEYEIENNFSDNWYSNFDIIDNSDTNNKLVDNYLNLFFISELWSPQKCFTLRNKSSSYFENIISKNIVFNKLLWKNYNFEKDHWLRYLDWSWNINNWINYCDYKDSIMLIQNY